VTEPVLLDVSDRIATVTLNRPEARNALSSEVLRLLPSLMHEADGRDDVDVVILTGADPAFCAGLDLKELGSSGGNLRAGNADSREVRTEQHGPFPLMEKPVIGAINGAAITGGFELALNCDFLVASERALFGDTHTRVGVMPGWGLTVLLPQAIGVRRAKEMSFTGNFLDAHEAFAWGLVNHVVKHEELLAFSRGLATDIAGNDQRGVRQIRKTYDAVTSGTVGDGWDVERRDSRDWQRTAGFDPAEVERRRAAIIQRGHSQT
jgi:enoyl-CoA hydratase